MSSSENKLDKMPDMELKKLKSMFKEMKEKKSTPKRKAEQGRQEQFLDVDLCNDSLKAQCVQPVCQA